MSADGGARSRPDLSPEWRAFLEDARYAVLVTVGPGGLPRPVPICFATGPDPLPLVFYTPLDEKPKRTADPRALARVRDILARPDVTLLVDRWDEDWTRLAWLRLHGVARLLEPGGPDAAEHAGAVAALRARYRQYERQALERRPVIRIEVTRIVAWGDPRDGTGGDARHAHDDGGERT